MCKFKQCKLVIAVFTLLVVIFDLGSDWYAFSDFLGYGQEEYDRRLTLALAALCAVSTILFLVEIRNIFVAFRIYDDDSNYAVQGDDLSKAQASLERWQEVVTFLQVVFEDFPIAVIVYIAFRWGSCPLFRRLFEDSFTGNLALLAAFASSIWKVLTAFIYCCCGRYRGVRSCGWKCCCCCQRTFRAMVAIMLCGFTAYLFFTFNARGVASRGDCMPNATATTLGLPL